MFMLQVIFDVDDDIIAATNSHCDDNIRFWGLILASLETGNALSLISNTSYPPCRTVHVYMSILGSINFYQWVSLSLCLSFQTITRGLLQTLFLNVLYISDKKVCLTCFINLNPTQPVATIGILPFSQILIHHMYNKLLLYSDHCEHRSVHQGHWESWFISEDTWDEKVILMKKNVPWPALGFFDTSWWWEWPPKFSKSGHCRILRKCTFYT